MRDEHWPCVNQTTLSVTHENLRRSLQQGAVALLMTVAIVGSLALLSARAQQPTAPKVAKSQKSATDLEAVSKSLIAQHGIPSTDVERQRSLLGANPRRVIHFIRPAETDPRIDRFLKDHYVLFHKGVKSNGQLFLFMPGTYGRPANYQLLLDTAAMAGYQVLGLEYINSTDDPGGSINELCAPRTRGRVVRPAAFGKGCASTGTTSARWSTSVGPTPSSTERRRAARLPRRTIPREGWGQFLRDGYIVWSKVAVGGHSQGAGMAAFIAKRHLVARVCLFSVWDDHNPVTHGPAPWLLEKSATPVARYFALFHEQESFAEGSLAACKALGLATFGASLKMTADGSLPRGRSHIIILTLDPNPQTEGRATGDSLHSSTVGDFSTPRDRNNRPAYRTAWLHVIGG